MAKKNKPGQKRCPNCGAAVRGPRTKICPKCGHEFNGRPQEAPAPVVAVAAAQKSAKTGDTITLEQLRAASQMVKAMGGFGRLNDMLGLIREIGGLRRFKDLLDAMAVTAAD